MRANQSKKNRSSAKKGKRSSGSESAHKAQSQNASKDRPLSAFYAHGPATGLLSQAKFAFGKAGGPFEGEVNTVADHLISGRSMPAITPDSSGSISSIARMASEEGSNDALEKEADAVSEVITQNGAAAPLTAPRKSPAENTLQRKKNSASKVKKTVPKKNGDSEQSIQLPDESGEPLSRSMRDDLEGSLGRDMGDVRVHQSKRTSEIASGLKARAFTHLNHIWLGDGESASDRKLIAHEATHVVQQTSGDNYSHGQIQRQVQPSFQSDSPPPLSPLEANGSHEYAEEQESDLEELSETSSIDVADLTTENPSVETTDLSEEENPDQELADGVDESTEEAGDSDSDEVQGDTLPEDGGDSGEGEEGDSVGSGGTYEPAEGEVDTGGSQEITAELAELSSSDVALIDEELAEHQRWAGATAQVGTAGSVERAAFIAEAAGGGFLNGFASGAAMGLGMGLVGRAAARFVPIPGVGSILAGGMSAYGLATRDWGQTGETISNFGEGSSDYEVLANSIASIAEIIDIVSNILNVIAGILGVISAVMWIITVATVGVAAPLAGTLSSIALGITAVTGILDGINAGILQPCVALFRALHTFTSQADPREVQSEGAGISAAAGAAGGALGGLAGGALANAGAGRGGRGGDADAPHSRPTADSPPSARGGDGPTVHYESGPAPRSSADAPTSAVRPDAPSSLVDAPSSATTPDVPPGFENSPAWIQRMAARGAAGEGPAWARGMGESLTAPGGRAAAIDARLRPWADRADAFIAWTEGEPAPRRRSDADAEAAPAPAPAPEADAPLMEDNGQHVISGMEPQGTRVDSDTPSSNPPEMDAPASLEANPNQLGLDFDATPPVADADGFGATPPPSAESGPPGGSETPSGQITSDSLFRLPAGPDDGPLRVYPDGTTRPMTGLQDLDIRYNADPSRIAYHENMDFAGVTRIDTEFGDGTTTSAHVPTRDSRADPTATRPSDRPHILEPLPPSPDGAPVHGPRRLVPDPGTLPPHHPQDLQVRTHSANPGAPGVEGPRPMVEAPRPITDSGEPMIGPMPAEPMIGPLPLHSSHSQANPTTQINTTGGNTYETSPGSGTYASTRSPDFVTAQETAGGPVHTRGGAQLYVNPETGTFVPTRMVDPVAGDIPHPDIAGGHIAVGGRDRGPTGLGEIPGAPAGTPPAHPPSTHMPRPDGGPDPVLWSERPTERGIVQTYLGRPNTDVHPLADFDPDTDLVMFDNPAYRPPPAGPDGDGGGSPPPPSGVPPVTPTDPSGAASPPVLATQDAGSDQSAPTRVRIDTTDIPSSPPRLRVDTSENSTPSVERLRVRVEDPETARTHQAEQEAIEAEPQQSATHQEQVHNPNPPPSRGGGSRRDEDGDGSSGNSTPFTAINQGAQIAQREQQEREREERERPSDTPETGQGPASAPTSSSSTQVDQHQPPDVARQVGQMFLPQFFGPDGEAPTTEERHAAHNARFTEDNQVPGEAQAGVERVNPQYPPPPGTPQQLEAIQQEISNLLATRAEAEQAQREMSAREAEGQAQQGPIQESITEMDGAVSATEAHQASVARRQQLNQEQQQRQSESEGLISGYPSRIAGASALMIPLGAFRDVSGLLVDIRDPVGSSARTINRDTTNLANAFQQMDSAMSEQAEAAPQKQEALSSDANALTSTGEEAESSGQQFQDAATGARELQSANEDKIAEARLARSEADTQEGQLDNAVNIKENQAQSLSEQLQSWAQEHKAARQRAVDQTAQRLRDEGYTGVEESSD